MCTSKVSLQEQKGYFNQLVSYPDSSYKPGKEDTWRHKCTAMGMIHASISNFTAIKIGHAFYSISTCI